MQRQYKQVVVKIAPKDYELLKELVNKGYYKNMSDAVVSAIRLLLDRYFRGEEVI